eukprot:GHVU01230798.1.p1 GENE.GHVU01230798.1~~GHVU01230798.1.p1  ORF type:complete len:300 (+),score=42.69 GHVU01230798.1:461-1360(+)
MATATWEDYKQGKYQGVNLGLPQNVGADYTRDQVPDVLRDDIYDLAVAAHHFAHMRFVECKSPPKQNSTTGYQFEDTGSKAARELIQKMGECFDLRTLARSPGLLHTREAALEYVHSAAVDSGCWMPQLVHLREQIRKLVARLGEAASTPEFKKKWFFLRRDGTIERSRPGAVIMKDLFTTPAFYQGIEDILYVFERCALKSCNEAVVEGVTSVVGRHAAADRGSDSDTITAETLVHYNGPLLHEADGIIEEALNRYFGEGKWHFDHFSDTGRAGPYAQQSAVLTRLKADKSRLPFLKG